MNSRFDWTILEAINNAFRAAKAAPLVLGGVEGSGGGGGGPTGGFVGKLPQSRVTYDLSELASSDTPASGASLLDNLNHIRYRLSTVESGGGGNPLSVEEGGVEISSAVTVLNFTGSGVNVSEDSPGNVIIDISSGGGGSGSYTEDDSPPLSGVAGDRWFNTASGILFTYVDDTDSSQWVELSPGGSFASSGSGGGHTIQYNGVSLSERTYLNFVGSGVVVTDDSGNDKTIVTISGSGGSSFTQVYASYETATAQSIAQADYVIVNYDTVVEDTGSTVTTGASWKFTAPSDGLYQISASVRIGSDTAFTSDPGGMSLRVMLNGNTSSYSIIDEDRTPKESKTTWASGCIIMRLSAGDYISMLAVTFQNAGVLKLLANEKYNWIQIMKVGS